MMLSKSSKIQQFCTLLTNIFYYLLIKLIIQILLLTTQVQSFHQFLVIIKIHLLNILQICQLQFSIQILLQIYLIIHIVQTDQYLITFFIPFSRKVLQIIITFNRKKIRITTFCSQSNCRYLNILRIEFLKQFIIFHLSIPFLNIVLRFTQCQSPLRRNSDQYVIKYFFNIVLFCGIKSSHHFFLQIIQYFQIFKRDMNSSWLQQTRFPLQSIQALERAIVKQMFLKLENPKESVIIDNKINIFIKMIQQKAKQGIQQFRDQDNLKKQQLAVISGQKNLPSIDKSKAPNIWQNFYQKMKQLKELHKKFTPIIDPPTNTVEYFNKIVFSAPYKQPQFSTQQSKGKFVDMHTLYLQYLNVYKSLNFKQDQKFGDYLWYLQNFDKFDDIPVPTKLKNLPKYMGYLKILYDYLYNYISKIRPLINTDIIINQIQIDFIDKYQKGQIQGWQKNGEEETDSKSVYCVNCKKIFINQDTYVNHLHGKKHLKAVKTEKKDAQHENRQIDQQNEAKIKFKQQHDNKKKSIAILEYKIFRLRDQLANVLYDTMNLIRKKQTRGYQQQQEINQQSQQSQLDPDQPVYNPKNLPLGWDGKPIPYWLYKLHGLGVQYKCQICGNYSYWGRRSFEMHFQEWRHTYGMKCLRIPNTIHFKDVTTINDALALHQKLLAEAEASQFRPDVEQQFEDTEGNIINRKTYHDMKKQGIL